MTGQDILNAAQKYIGVPYVWGGTTCNGMDCSGFVQRVLSDVGISLPRTAQQMYNWFAAKTALVTQQAAQIGDLLFFHVPGETGKVNHTGIYAGNGQMYAESSSAGRAVLQKVPSNYDILGVGSIGTVAGTQSGTGFLQPGTNGGLSISSPAYTFGGTSLTRMMLALGVLAGVTFVTPSKYASYVPWLVLLGYFAFRSSKVEQAATALGSIGGT